MWRACIPQPRITLASSEVKRILGVEIPAAEIARILRRLGFTVELAEASVLPSKRP